MMKMTTAKALELLGLPSEKEVLENGLSIKKAYKQAALRLHPDRKGNKDDMAALNCAYKFLKKSLPEPTPELMAEMAARDAADHEFYMRNEGHELWGAGIPALKPRDQLLRELFDIRDTVDRMPGISPAGEYDKNKLGCNKGAYFQFENNDYHISWVSRDNFYVSRITNGGRSGKTCPTIRLCIEKWGYESCYQCTGNVFRQMFKDSPYAEGEPESGFSWGRVFEDLMVAFEKAVVASDDVRTADFYGYTLTERDDNYGSRWALNVDGNDMVIYVREETSLDMFNPFALDVYKPLKAIPEKFKTLDLIKILANGQYADYKRDYYHTDDYAYDAAVRAREGVIENPFNALKDWIEHRGRRSSCASVYCHNGCASFGFHLNDSSSLKVVIDNRFPLVDLTSELVALGETKMIAA